MVSRLKGVADHLDATLVDMRFVKPLDVDCIIQMAKTHDLLVCAEDGVIAGGAGSGVLEVLASHGVDVDTMLFRIGDHFVGQGSDEELMKENGLDEESILAAIEKRLE